MSTLCITPNLALDRTLVVPGFAVGNVWRASQVRVAVGGKGVNIARTLAGLGKANHLAGLIGGAAGQLASQSAADAGLTATWSPVAGETRTRLLIVSAPNAATVISEPGPTITESEWARFEADIAQLSHGRTAICISGSLPPGSPANAMQRLIAAATGEGQPVWVDSSGEPLANAIEAPVFAIKVNGDEAAAFTGRTVRTVTDALVAAQSIVDRGVSKVAVTLGPQGAVLVEGETGWYARPPVINVENPVGHGDSFLAGLLAAYGDGLRDEDALRLATACGTATALAAWTDQITSSKVTRVAAEIAVHPIYLT